MTCWSDAGTWAGDGLRREVFFFPSSDVELYGSVYATANASAPLGLVICNSWGYEADLASTLVHPLSIALAKAGGVAVSFHYPGAGDSLGDPDETTIDLMATAAGDAMSEASRRYPRTRWILAGFRLGASIAALAAGRGVSADGLLLIQPALSPSRYFARLERISKRSIGRPSPPPSPGFAHGYRLAQPLLDSAPDADAEVEAALASVDVIGTIVRCEAPAEVEGASEHFEEIRVEGSWRYGARNHSKLVRATAEWLRHEMAAAA